MTKCLKNNSIENAMQTIIQRNKNPWRRQRLKLSEKFQKQRNISVAKTTLLNIIRKPEAAKNRRD